VSLSAPISVASSRKHNVAAHPAAYAVFRLNAVRSAMGCTTHLLFDGGFWLVPVEPRHARQGGAAGSTAGAYSPGVRCSGAGGFLLSASPASSISKPDCSTCSTRRSASIWRASLCSVPSKSHRRLKPRLLLLMRRRASHPEAKPRPNIAPLQATNIIASDMGVIPRGRWNSDA
jgi:hypothetical protein